MKRFNWALVVAALFVAAAIVVYALSNRFYVDSAKGIKYDRFTGRTYKIYYTKDKWGEDVGTRWIEIK